MQQVLEFTYFLRTPNKYIQVVTCDTKGYNLLQLMFWGENINLNLIIDFNFLNELHVCIFTFRQPKSELNECMSSG